jgi:hypothetical protein
MTAVGPCLSAPYPLCGYSISFDYDNSGTYEGITYYEFWEFVGNLSEYGNAIGGTHEYYAKIGGYPESFNFNGTWILSR